MARVSLGSSFPGLTALTLDANFADLYGAQFATDPVATNDNSQGYGIGSTWVNTSANRVWRAISVTTGAAVWALAGTPQNNSVYVTSAAVAGFTATAAQISGGLVETYLDLTGTLTAGAALTLPLVTSLVSALPGPTVGQSYRLRVINRSSATFTWTVTTNTGWTLTGLMTVAQNTWRDFVVTLNSLTTATLQTVGIGTAP